MKWLKKKRFVKVGSTGMVSAALSCVCAVPAFASGSGSAGGLTTMLETFTSIAAWLWTEVGLFCTFVLGQPMLLIALAIPFVGLIVNFFMRIFKTI